MWRKAAGDYIAGMEWGGPVDLDRNQYVVCPVGTMSKILLALVEKQPHASVFWQHKVQSVGQDEQQAWIDFEDASGSTGRMTADFVVGCDGGTSNVRKSLFGKSFPGFTWPYQFIAVNVSHDRCTAQRRLTRAVRFTTTWKSTGGLMRTGSLILNIGSTLLKSHLTASGALLTARHQGSLSINPHSRLESNRNYKSFSQEIQLQINSDSPLSLHTASIRDLQSE